MPVLALFLAFAAALQGAGQADAGTTRKTRRIHLVYDDSGSMCVDDSWSQAKYALEIFAAMVGEGDTLAVYPMSKVNDDATMEAGYPIVFDSSQSGADRVRTVVEEMTDFGGTPIETVEAAGYDLQAAEADEKWLVVMTDGGFGSYRSSMSTSDMQNLITGYADETCRVIYYGIGAATHFDSSSARPGFQDIYTDSDTIRETITDIATQVFGLQKIPHSGTGTVSFSADIPLSRIIILAQGKAVTVSDLSLDGAKGPDASQVVPVSVTKDTEPVYQDDNSMEIAEGLEGVVSTFSAADEQKPFAPGNYSFTTNADNVEVYYEPGVLLAATIEPVEGSPVDILHGQTDELPAGKWKVHLAMINPLTGEELTPDSSPLLTGASLNLRASDESGGERDVVDGETLELEEGTVTLQASASFPGGVRLLGDPVTAEVGSNLLRISFGEKKYGFDPVTLTPSAKIEMTVNKSGAVLPDADYRSMQFEFTGTDGIVWNAQYSGSGGVFTLTPEYADKNAGAGGVATGKQQLQAEAWLGDRSGDVRGTGLTVIEVSETVTADLVLEMELPPESIEAGGSRYMFDPEETGADAGGPCITVRFWEARSDGTKRALTDSELEEVMKNFRYASQPKDASPLWQLISFLCFQKLEFEPAPASEPSACLLYLSGSRASAIRPNLSHLKVSSSFTFPNGIKAKGSAEGDVSVKPLPVMTYILPALIAAAIALFILVILIMEIRKPRFSRSIVPVTTGMVTENGVPVDPENLPRPKYGGKAVEYRFFPPARAEERSVMMEFPGYMSPVMFRIRAVRGGGFVIVDLAPFERFKDEIMFNGVSYAQLKKQEKVFTSGSVFKRYYTDDDDRVTIIQSFRRPRQ